MKIQDLNGKSVCMLGYGREGQAMVEAIEEFAPECEVTIADQNPKCEIRNPKHWKQLGEGWLENLDKFDILIKSPGIPPSTLATNPQLPTTNSTQIFLDSVPPEVTVIGVTGSKGKSTTASLIHHILKTAGKESLLLGNIGEPSIGALKSVSSGQFVILEMSSAQLIDCTTSPHIAVVTSFFPEHLDYHGDLENYKEAKKNIARFQNENDTVFYFENAKEIADISPGTKVAYTEDNSPIAVQDTKLVGTHNLVNIAGAASVARHLKITDELITEAIRNFEGLPHRLQDLGLHHDIHWVDDAISTTPESTIAAIHALSPNVKILICGGLDRGLDFGNLGEVIDVSSIEHVICMGESGSRIAKTISKKNVVTVSSLEEAVLKAISYKLKAISCLLSPASPSYDQFKNFEEKGNLFKSLIRA